MKNPAFSKVRVQACLKRLFIFWLFVLVCAFNVHGSEAATPSSGASCADNTNGTVACYTNGCYVCTAGSWVQQALHIGNTSQACNATYAGMIRWTGAALEYCSGSAWTGASNTSAQITGEIVVWHTSSPPAGYLQCDGSAVSRVTYANLFAVIGTTYGAGNGSTTFNLPNYKGQFLRGWAHGDTTRDPDYASRTNRGDGVTGNHVGTLQASAAMGHYHTISPPNTTSSTRAAHAHTWPYQAASNEFGTAGSSTGCGGSVSSGIVSSAAGSHTHTLDVPTFSTASAGTEESRPPNIYVMYVIKY